MSILGVAVRIQNSFFPTTHLLGRSGLPEIFSLLIIVPNMVSRNPAVKGEQIVGLLNFIKEVAIFEKAGRSPISVFVGDAKIGLQHSMVMPVRKERKRNGMSLALYLYNCVLSYDH
jgi:hypothetical protein